MSSISFSEYQNNERIIYIGCSSLLAIAVIILIAILCYKNTRQNTILDNVETKQNTRNGSEENNAVQWKNEKNVVNENEYDEIDESLLCDIRTTIHEENKRNSDEDDYNKQSIEAAANEGYLNPYQPIISMAVDVHQYSSTTNDTKDNLTTSEENQRESDYLQQYQSLTKNTSDPKHEYTRLENLDTDIPEIDMDGKISLEKSAQYRRVSI